METKTGKVRAIANLGRANDGTYYETTNYAVAESHEPGSTFKLVDLMAILEDKVADTSTVYDTYGGEIFRKAVRDSHKGGYGKYLWLEDSSYPQIPLWFRRFTKITK
jgi:cell division protein FtsI (penicillin-binding protein 3)